MHENYKRFSHSRYGSNERPLPAHGFAPHSVTLGRWYSDFAIRWARMVGEGHPQTSHRGFALTIAGSLELSPRSPVEPRVIGWVRTQVRYSRITVGCQLDEPRDGPSIYYLSVASPAPDGSLSHVQRESIWFSSIAVPLLAPNFRFVTSSWKGRLERELRRKSLPCPSLHCIRFRGRREGQSLTPITRQLF